METTVNFDVGGAVVIADEADASGMLLDEAMAVTNETEQQREERNGAFKAGWER